MSRLGECGFWKQTGSELNIKLKLLLVDDHAILRGGLRQFLAQQPDLVVTGEASNGGQALLLAAEVIPDIVLMDIHLPDMNGLEVSRKMLHEHPAIKIIIFSGDTTHSVVDEALRLGVCGYLSKTSAPEKVADAIASVMNGKLYLSPDVSSAILDGYRRGLSKGAEPAKPPLSEREKQLLRLVAEGQRNKQISNRMNITSRSVEVARSRLMKKLGCSSPAELVRYSVREGIAPL